MTDFCLSLLILPTESLKDTRPKTVCPANLMDELFTTAAVGNIDHNIPAQLLLMMHITELPFL